MTREALLDLLDHPAAERLGWTLLHFLWQGAAVAALLLTAQWRLRRETQPVEGGLREALDELSATLGVSRRVWLAEAAWVQVPAVVGALRPVLLLPAAAFTGLTPEQLRALLAHELAHVRRHDYA